MAYAVMRLEKFKRSAVHGISLERNRTEKEEREFAASDIDKSQTPYNVDFLKTEHWNSKITKIIKDNNVQERSNSVVMIGGVFTAAAEFFTQNPNYIPRDETTEIDLRTPEQKQKWIQDEKTMQFFKDCEQSYVDMVCDGDRSRLISSRIDFDERTPHLQCYSVPLFHDQEKMKLSARDIFGDRAKMRAKQDYFYEKVGKQYGLERGEKVPWDKSPKEIRKHKKTIDYKKEQNKKLEAALQRGVERGKQMKSSLETLKQERDEQRKQNMEIQKELAEGIERVQVLEETIQKLKGEEENNSAAAAAAAVKLAAVNEETRKAQEEQLRTQEELMRTQQELDNVQNKFRDQKAKYLVAKERTKAEAEKVEKHLDAALKALPETNAFGMVKKDGPIVHMHENVYLGMKEFRDQFLSSIDKITEADFTSKEAYAEFQELRKNQEELIKARAERLYKERHKDLEQQRKEAAELSKEAEKDRNQAALYKAKEASLISEKARDLANKAIQDARIPDLEEWLDQNAPHLLNQFYVHQERAANIARTQIHKYSHEHDREERTL